MSLLYEFKSPSGVDVFVYNPVNCGDNKQGKLGEVVEHKLDGNGRHAFNRENFFDSKLAFSPATDRG